MTSSDGFGCVTPRYPSGGMFKAVASIVSPCAPGVIAAADSIGHPTAGEAQLGPLPAETDQDAGGIPQNPGPPERTLSVSAGPDYNQPMVFTAMSGPSNPSEAQTARRKRQLDESSVTRCETTSKRGCQRPQVPYAHLCPD